MTFLIDTNIAIHWRDGDAEVVRRALMFQAPPAISIITHVELTNGIHAQPRYAEARRRNVEDLYRFLQVIDFDQSVAQAYDSILAQTGFSRTRIFDRLIAATAIVHDLTLVTINGADFADIPGLKLQVWPAPAAQ